MPLIPPTQEAIMAGLAKTPDGDLKRILAQAIAASARAAFECGVCNHTENPHWILVHDALDRWTDDLREIEKSLT